ncbi:MAG: glycine--tRNA ligase subunit beta [Hyphomicrobiales bacterium]|nr:glycine--tRNA ligase subunit beta [Hyphomicrobiales bacterium]
MSELLLELFSEEIPAGLQARAGADLQRLVCDGLKEAGLKFGEARNFAGPRRLTLVIDGLPEKSPDISEERKGPRVGSPDKAVEGFLRAAGLKSVDEAEIVTDEKKGDFYVARIEKPGRATGEIVAELIADVIRQFPWPKSQRWGAGTLKWVRPLHSILCLLGGNPVHFEVDGIKSGGETRGHRFMAPEPFAVKDFADYEKKLRTARVIVSAEERQTRILEGAQAAAQKAKLELVEDKALLAENAGLVEWPVVLMGGFDEAFLDVPGEVIVTAIKKHQKCFSLRDPKTGKLANNFILVSNLKAEDGGKAIIAGNERVVRARLSDAKFFWDQDRKHTLESRLPRLNELIFHDKLGTVHDKAHAIARLAMDLSQAVPDANKKLCEQAAILAKADLVTDMVGEFPDLQGVMGSYYALNDGLPEEVAEAVARHYSPLGPTDAVPARPVAIVAALSDKLYSLVGFFGIEERPTGSRDPYALRRTALGIIRIVLENKLRLNLTTWFTRTTGVYRDIGENVLKNWTDSYDVNAELRSFFHDRLKVYMRDGGARHDLIDAVISPEADDLLMIVARVEALGNFLDTDDGANLLAGVKRATNIIRIEEKKDKRTYDGAPDTKLLQETQEKTLGSAIANATTAAEAAVAKEDFEGAMSAIAGLRAPVDAFFDHVTVNADDAKLRENRLKLLNQIREATLAVADFSKIEG